MKGKFRRRRRRIEGNFLLSFTSMTDMFTNVLLFLLFFVNPAAVEDSNFSLPKSEASTAVAPGPRVRVARDGVAVEQTKVLPLVNGNWPSAPTAEQRTSLVKSLAGLRATLPADTKEAAILVECDETVAWSVLGPVLESAEKAGFGAYRLVVLGSD